MNQSGTEPLTEILDEVGRGDAPARQRLLALVYDELHQMASDKMRAERPDHTLGSTALVHETYLRLFGGRIPTWENRAHFFGTAAEIMRRILVDHARAKLAAKRGGDFTRLPFADGEAPIQVDPDVLIAVDEALGKFESVSPERARLVEMRFFAGLSVEETAHALGLSERTIKRQWRFAKAWLFREMSGKGIGGREA